MDLFRKYISGPQGGNVSSGAETVERLCDRVQSSTLLDDRRDAVRALKSLSRKFRLEVGTQALDILIQVLKNDRNDSEIIGYALETLCNITSNEPPEEESDQNGTVAAHLPDDLGLQFTEMFIKNSENVSLLLSLLQEYDFHVLWPTVRLLTTLLMNRTKEIQEIILANTMGISKMMDLLLTETREVIRNDDLLLLIALTRNNTNIQKIVAFENAFERLFNIIRDEGDSDGGVVVEDCLLLLLNLLKNNISNQNFLKEGSYIQRLPAYFDLKQADKTTTSDGWSAQKVSNVHLMLQIVRTMVSPNNPQQQTTACQKVMHQCGLLEKLCTILMASGIPADVLTETINTVSEVIRGNHSNQEYFASVVAPSNPPRPAIVVLLMSMVNEKQPFVLRSAVLYCFQSFLYKNELGQSQIVQTLLPSSAEVNSMSAGQLLCAGLFSQDPLSTWFAAVALLHAIVDNPAQKEQLLRVQLATNLGNPPVSLIQQCTNILSQGAKLQTRVGLLMLLCHWMANCPIAVTYFLHNIANVPYLISQVSASEGDELELIVQGLCAFLLGICVLDNNNQVPSYHQSDLRLMIQKRVGMELFTDKLSQLAKHESYSHAAKKPQLTCKQPSDVIFDYEFTQLLKKLENDVLRSVSPMQDGEADKKRASVEQHSSIVEQYKKIIREQDMQLNATRAELQETLSRTGDSQRKFDEMAQQIQQLKDQNALLKTQRGSSATLQGDLDEMSRLHRELDESRRTLQSKNQLIDKLTADLLSVESRLALTLDARPASDEVMNHNGGMSHVGGGAGDQTLAADLEELRRRLDQKEEEMKLYRGKYEEVSRQLSIARAMPTATSGDDSNIALLTERNNLSLRASELELKVSRFNEDRKETELRIQQLKEENAGLLKRMQVIELEKTEVELDKDQTLAEMDNMKKEQDDLLVLLTDQDTKVKAYRKRLKELGEKLEDDDDDDDDIDDQEGGEEAN